MKIRKLLVMLVLVAVAFGLTTACRWGSNFDDGSPTGAGTNAPAIPGFTPEQIAEIIGVAQSEKANVTLPVTFPAASFYRFDLKNEKGANRLSTILSYQDVLGTPTYGLESTARVILFQALQANLGYEFDYFGFEKTLPKTTVDRVVTAMATRFGDVEFLLRSDLAIASAPEVVTVVQELLPGLGKPAPASLTVQLLGSAPVEIDLKPRFSMLDNATLMKLIFNDELRALFAKLQKDGLANSPYFAANLPTLPRNSLRSDLRGASRFGANTVLMGPVWATAKVDVTPVPLASESPLTVRLVDTASGPALQVAWTGPAFTVGAWKLEQLSKILEGKRKADSSKPGDFYIEELGQYQSTATFLLQGLSAEMPTFAVEEAQVTVTNGGQTIATLGVRKGETALLPLSGAQAERLGVRGTITLLRPGSGSLVNVADEGAARIREFLAIEKIEDPHPIENLSVAAFFPASPSLRVTGLATGSSHEIVVYAAELMMGNSELNVRSISPASAAIGAEALEITVVGAGFTADANIRLTSWVGGAMIPATSVSLVQTGELRGRVSLVSAAPGLYSVEVFKPNGQTAVGQNLFTVNGPPPTVAAISPNRGTSGGMLKNVLVTGTNLWAGAKVFLTRSGFPSLAASSVDWKGTGTLACSFDLAGMASGVWNLELVNPDDQRGEAANLFTVVGIPPVVTGFSPADIPSLEAFDGLTIDGAGFHAGLTVRLVRANQPPVIGTVTSVQPTRIVCGFSLGAAVKGGWRIEVINPDGQSAAAEKPIAIFAPLPSIRSVLPVSADNSGMARGVQISGTGFATGATVQLVRTGKAPIPATNVVVGSAASLTCDFDLTGVGIGTWSIALQNPDGLETTSAGLFGVQPSAGTPAPVVTSINPAAFENRGRQTGLVIKGSGFRTGAMVVLTRSGETPVSADSIVVSDAGSLTCALDSTRLAVGTWSVTVTNPDDQSGTGDDLLTITAAAPVIASMTPVRASIIGTASIALTGSAFQPGAQLALVNGAVERPAIEVTATTWTSLTGLFDLRGLEPGSYTLRVTNPDGGKAIASKTFQVLALPPRIDSTSHTPHASDPLWGGWSYTFQLNGANFQPGATVRFLRWEFDPLSAANVVVDRPDHLSFTFGFASQVGEGNWVIEVTNPDGQKGTTVVFVKGNIVLGEMPGLYSVSPASGYNDRTTTVTLVGNYSVENNFGYYVLVRSGYPSRRAVDSKAGRYGYAPNGNHYLFSASFDLTGLATGAYWLGARRLDGTFINGTTFTVLAPPPTVTAVVPNAAVNNAPQIVNIKGSGFTSGMSVRLVGSGSASIPGTVETLISSGSMDCRFDLTGAEAAPWNIEVKNADGQGASLAAALMVIPPVVTIASISPAFGTTVDPALPFKITGAGFKEGTSVFIRRGPRTVWGRNLTRSGYYQLSGTFNLVGLSVGAWDLGVEIPGESPRIASGAFQVRLQPPTLASISPVSGVKGNTPTTVTIKGSGFQSDIVTRLVRAGEQPIAGSNLVFKSATEVTAEFALAGKPVGAWDLVAENPDGGIASLPGAFQVKGLPSSVTAIAPAVSSNGAPSASVTITGTGFQAGCLVRLLRPLELPVAGMNLVFKSATELTCDFPVAGKALGAWDLQVENPDGGLFTLPGAFSILLSAPTITSVGVSSGPVSLDLTVPINGTGFAEGAVVRIMNASLTVVANKVTRTDATLLTAVFPGSALRPGVFDLEVTNPNSAPGIGKGLVTIRDLPPDVSVVLPASGTNDGIVRGVKVIGHSFQDGSTFRLTRSGLAPVSATNIAVTLYMPRPYSQYTIQTDSMTGDLDLNGVPTGVWDLEILNPDAQSGTRAGCFTVGQGQLTRPAPSATALTPDKGENTGMLSSVQVTGTGFLPWTSARLTRSGYAPVVATGVRIISATSLVCSFDLTGLAYGNWSLETINPDGQVGTAATPLFVRLPTLTVTGVTPATGFNNAVLGNVQITGTRFVSGISARLTRAGHASVPATGLTLTGETTVGCSFDLTGLASGSWKVEAVNPDGQVATWAGVLDVTAIPTVTAAQPSTGLNVDTVNGLQIRGTEFGSGMTVKFVRAGQTAVTATNVTLVNATTLTCSIDLVGLTTGAWNIEVTRPGVPAGTGLGLFTVTAPGVPAVGSIAPTQGENTGSVNLQITGSGFASGAVAFLTKAGSAPVSGTGFTLTGTTQLAGTFNLTGLATGAWNVEVMNSGGATGTGSGMLTVRTAPPTVTGVSPVRAFANSVQNNVQVTGTNFFSGLSIRLTRAGYAPIAATNVNRISSGAASCTFDLTGLATGVWNIEVANLDGQGATGTNLFTVAPAPWKKSIGGTGAESELYCIEASDGGFFVAGTTSSGDGDMSGFKGGANDVWIARVNDQGTILWSKLIGGTGDDRVSGMAAAGTGFALAGSSDSPMGDLWLGSPDSTKRAWAATFDASGNILRLNQFTNPSSSQPSDARGGIRATADGGFLIAGTVFDGAYWYGWAVKFNSLLQEQWQRRLAANSGYAYAYDVAEKADNRNVLLCGYTEFGAGAFAGTGWHGGNDGFVFELASETGAIVRGVCLGGTGTDRCTGVVPIPGGGLYVIGTTGSTDGTCSSTHAISDLMLYKLQSDFTVDWAKSVGGSGSETGGRGQLASDGSLLFLGTTTSVDGDCTGAHASGNIFSDYWLGKCSSAGTLQWQRFYGGDNEDDFATGLALTADGGFLLGGYARSDTGDFAGIGHRNANYEFVLIRERTLSAP